MQRQLLAVQTDPASHEAWNRLGELMVCLDRTEEAETFFLRSLSAGPGGGEAARNVADLYRHSGSFRAEIRAREIGQPQAIGRRFPLKLWIRNVGSRSWLSARHGRTPLLVGVRLLDTAGEPVKQIVHHPLARTVRPGEEVDVEIPMRIVHPPGEYTLKIDLLIQHLAWFETIGSRPLLQRLTLADTPTPITSFMIELTNVCNFNCTFCPNETMNRKRGFMDPGLFEGIIDELHAVGFENPIGLHVMGEPLLHPKFADLVGYAQRKGIRIELHTNGMPMSDELLDVVYRHDNIVRFWISYHTPSEALFLETRRPRAAKRDGLYAQYLSRVRRAVRKKFETGSETELRIYLMATHRSRDLEVVDDNATARDLLGEWYAFAETVEAEYGLRYDREPLHDRILDGIQAKQLYPILENTAIRFVPWHDWGGTFHLKSDRPVECKNPWFQFAVLWNGDCTTCCLDYDGEIPLGNIRDHAIAEIWEGKRMREIREGFLRAEAIQDRCKRCF